MRSPAKLRIKTYLWNSKSPDDKIPFPPFLPVPPNSIWLFRLPLFDPPLSVLIRLSTDLWQK